MIYFVTYSSLRQADKSISSHSLEISRSSKHSTSFILAQIGLLQTALLARLDKSLAVNCRRLASFSQWKRTEWESSWNNRSRNQLVEHEILLIKTPEKTRGEHYFVHRIPGCTIVNRCICEKWNLIRTDKENQHTGKWRFLSRIDDLLLQRLETTK